MLTTSNINYFYGRFSVLSVLRIPFKLKIFNCSYYYRSELAVHRGSMVEVIIPKNCFIMFHCGLVYCRTPSWFISRGEHSSYTRSCFTIIEKYFNLRNKNAVQMENKFFSTEICDVCNNKTYGNMEGNGPLGDLWLVKKVNANINENQEKGKFNIINGNLNLLGWVVLKSDIVVADKYDLALAKLSILNTENHWQKLVNTNNKRSI